MHFAFYHSETLGVTYCQERGQATPFANAQHRSRHTQTDTDRLTGAAGDLLPLRFLTQSFPTHGECPLGPFLRLLPFPSLSDLVDAQRQSHCGVHLRWGSDGVLLEIIEDSVSQTHNLPCHLHGD